MKQPPQPKDHLTIHTHPEINDPEWIAAVTASNLKGLKVLTAKPDVPYLQLNTTQRLIIKTILPKFSQLEIFGHPLPTRVIHVLDEVAEKFPEHERYILFNPTATMFAFALETPGWSDKKHWLVATWGFAFDWSSLEPLAKSFWLSDRTAELQKVRGFVDMDLANVNNLVDQVFREGKDWDVHYNPLVKH